MQTLEPLDNGKSKITLFQELKSRRKTMVKIVWKEPKEDDPIFKTGFIISNPKLNFNKKRKERINEKSIFFSIPRNKTRKETIEVIKNSLIANGWKFVEKSERSKNKS